MKSKTKFPDLIISFGVLLILLSSCGSVKMLNIEIPSPGKKDLPEHIQSLAIVARIPYPIFSDVNRDSLQKAFYKHAFKLDTSLYDLAAADTMLKVLGELLFETGRYDFVIPKERFLMKNKTFLSPEMSWDEVDQLCKTYQTDAVLSLEHFRTKVSTDFTKQTVFNPENLGRVQVGVAKMVVYCEAYFRIYDVINKQVIYRELTKDTLFWEDADKSTTELFIRFTPVKQALVESGIETALALADKLGTKWKRERRYYFTKGSNELKTADNYIQTGEWDKAIGLWNKIVEKSNSKVLNSKAEFNLAIASELEGNIDSAISWALKSYNSQYRTITYDYLELLKKRKNESKK